MEGRHQVVSSVLQAASHCLKPMKPQRFKNLAFSRFINPEVTKLAAKLKKTPTHPSSTLSEK